MTIWTRFGGSNLCFKVPKHLKTPISQLPKWESTLDSILVVLGIHSSILPPLSFLLAHSPCHMSRLGSKHVDNVSWHQKLQIMWRTNLLVQWLCFKKHWSSNKPLFYVMGSKGHQLYNKKFLKVKCVHLAQTLLSCITCMVNQSKSHLLFSNALITSISVILNIGSWNGVCCW